jgi:hypothetical protein
MSEQNMFCNYCGKPLNNKTYCGGKHFKLNEKRKIHFVEQKKNGLLYR